MRTQKGITLVALIITIVVLMILAGVAISSINDQGILEYADNAATSWNEALKNEAGTLSNYAEYLANMGKCTHNWSNGKCTKCDITCAHEDGLIYSYDVGVAEDWQHLKFGYCKTCNSLRSEVSEACVVPAGDMYCGLCGANS